MLLLAAAILFSFQHVSETLLILLSLVIFLSKRDFITIFFKSFDFSVDFFAFSTKMCLYLSFPQMFMAVCVLKSNSELSGPCIETIINPCNMVLVGLFVPQCCLHSGHTCTTESPFTFNTLDKLAVELCNQKWNVDINVFIFSILFLHIHYFTRMYISNFRRYL